MDKTNRIYGIDALRAIAMLLGVILHAGIVYQVEPRPGWPVDNFQSFGFDALYHFIHSFRMEMFFIVAGFFARFLYYRKGENQFIIHRINRIFFPLILSLILIVPLSSFPFNYYYLVNNLLVLPKEAFIKSVLNMFTWNGFYHLWFLYNLLIFYFATILMLRIKKYNFLRRWTDNFTLTYTPKYILLYIVLIFCIYVLFFDHSVEPWTGIKPTIGQLIYYGTFFYIGYVFHRHSDSVYLGSKYTIVYLLTGISLCVINILDITENSIIIKLLISAQTVFLVFGFFGLFIRYFNKPNKVLNYISESSYWIYLLHFPLIVNLQLIFMESTVPGYYRFWYVLVITTIITLVTYHYFVRKSWVGTMLNGKKAKSSDEVYDRGILNFFREATCEGYQKIIYIIKLLRSAIFLTLFFNIFTY